MARIAGVDLPRDKRVEISLTSMELGRLCPVKSWLQRESILILAPGI